MMRLFWPSACLNPKCGTDGQIMPDVDSSVAQDWDTFGLVIGGASGALIGLLFVAISIRAPTIAASADLRGRAAQTLVIFVSPLMVAIMISIPGQPDWVFGAELVLLAALLTVGLVVLDHRARRSGVQRGLSRTLKVVNPSTLTAAGMAVSGVLLLAGVRWGIFVLVPSVCAAIVGGLASAWLFLTALGD
jgi:hypothetical protein